MAPEDMFRQCERYLCQEIMLAKGDAEEGSQEGRSSGSCRTLAQPSLDLSCSGGAFGKEGRSSVAILSGYCLSKE